MKSLKMAAVFLSICATLAILVIDSSYFPAFRRQAASSSYGQTSGMIKESEIYYAGYSYGNSVRRDVPTARIRYAYNADGVVREAVRFRYDWGGRSAESVVKSFPAGKSVVVFYNPQDPGDAVLSAGIDKRDRIICAFTVIMNVIVLLCAVAAGRWVWRRRRF